MSKITDSAKGKECLIRIPQVCSFDDAETIAAHVRIAGLCGTGIKPEDALTIRACFACHQAIDNVNRPKWLKQDELNLYILEGLARTINAYIQEGLLKYK